MIMADKTKTVDREQTLINVLERMADQIQKQDLLIAEVAKQQSGLIFDIANTEFSLGAQHNDTNSALRNIDNALNRYRSDLLSVVHEQDNIAVNFKEMRKLVDRSVYSLENNNHLISELDSKIKNQEKTVNDHFAHTLRQSEVVPKGLADLNRDYSRLHADTEKRLTERHDDTQRKLDNLNREFIKLHADTEKRLIQRHEETQRQLDKMKQELSRRLLALDGIESALNIILIRTEPPEKKPLLIVRVAKKIEWFFRKKLPQVFRKIRIRRRRER